MQAEGEGEVAAESLLRAERTFGPSCKGTFSSSGVWALCVRVEAKTVREAIDVAAVQVQAAAAAAGLPNWPIETVEGTGETQRIGPVRTSKRVIAGRARGVAGGDGSAGDREPRRPRGTPPSLMVSRETDEA